MTAARLLDRRRPRGEPGRLRGLIILAALVALGALGGAVFLFRSTGALGESTDAPSRREIELYGGIVLPPSARDLRSRLQLVLTKRTLIVRFTLDPADLPALLGSSRFRAAPLSSREIPEQLAIAPAPPWWAPEKARSFLAGTAGRAAILIDTGEPGGYVVYLVARS